MCAMVLTATTRAQHRLVRSRHRHRQRRDEDRARDETRRDEEEEKGSGGGGGRMVREGSLLLVELTCALTRPPQWWSDADGRDGRSACESEIRAQLDRRQTTDTDATTTRGLYSALVPFVWLSLLRERSRLVRPPSCVPVSPVCRVVSSRVPGSVCLVLEVGVSTGRVQWARRRDAADSDAARRGRRRHRQEKDTTQQTGA